jgi:hypothetical protein
MSERQSLALLLKITLTFATFFSLRQLLLTPVCGWFSSRICSSCALLGGHGGVLRHSCHRTQTSAGKGFRDDSVVPRE